MLLDVYLRNMLRRGGLLWQAETGGNIGRASPQRLSDDGDYLPLGYDE
jgi:hypothetical protein